MGLALSSCLYMPGELSGFRRRIDSEFADETRLPLGVDAKRATPIAPLIEQGHQAPYSFFVIRLDFQRPMRDRYSCPRGPTHFFDPDTFPSGSSGQTAQSFSFASEPLLEFLGHAFGKQACQKLASIQVESLAMPAGVLILLEGHSVTAQQ
jgi:hypothetical protein